MRGRRVVFFSVVVALHAIGHASVVSLGEDETPLNPSEAQAAALTATANLQGIDADINRQSNVVEEQIEAVEKLKAEVKTLTNGQMATNMKMHNTGTLSKEGDLAVQAADRTVTKLEDKIAALKSKAVDTAERVKNTKSALADAQGKFEAAQVIQQQLPKNSALTFQYTSGKVQTDQAQQNVDSAVHERDQLAKQMEEAEQELKDSKKAAATAEEGAGKLTTEVTATTTAHKQASKKAADASAKLEVANVKLANEKKKLSEMTDAKSGLQSAAQKAKQSAYAADAASKTKVMEETAKDEVPAAGQ